MFKILLFICCMIIFAIITETLMPNITNYYSFWRVVSGLVLAEFLGIAIYKWFL